MDFRTTRLVLLFVFLTSVAIVRDPGVAGDIRAVPPKKTEQLDTLTGDLSQQLITTFSIVAYDPVTGDYGIAVQSKYFAVGDVVPFAKANIGALATQARGDPLHGPEAMKLIAEAVPAQQVIERLLAADPLASSRQLGVVDAAGRPATYTGDQCLPWAGGTIGKHYAAQGNLLAGPHVIKAMAATYEATSGDLATRLVLAIEAGQAAGGDARGRQSAAVLVVRKKAGYLGLNDRHINLHVEDHVTPIRELKRLLNIRHAQLAAVETASYLDRVDGAKKAERKTLIKRARRAAERGIRLYKGDDYLWWLTARARWMDDDRAGAEEAGRAALLLSPSWTRLPEKTRAELGLPEPLVAALRQSDGFRALWDSLATKDTVE